MRETRVRKRIVATGRIGRVVQSKPDGSLHLVVLDEDESTPKWYRTSELVPVSSVLYFLRANSFRLFRTAASWSALLVPTSRWYRTAFQLSKLQAFILRPLIGFTPYAGDRRRSRMVAWLLNSWLRQLIGIKRSFPMKIQSSGQGVVIEASRHPGGVVICSLHMPLVNAVLHSLVEIGVPPAGVVAGKPEIQDGKIPVWGLQHDVPAIPDNQTALLKMRRILLQGSAVFALMDITFGDFPSLNLFRFIGRVGARAVLAITTLRPTGEIVVEYFDPPYPFCKTEESIVRNLEFLRSKLS